MLTEPWYIQLLGGLAASQYSVRIERFRSRKVATLFAYLALHLPMATSRELLGEMLWPDEELDTSRNRLRVTLASLRKQLEPPPMESGSILFASRSHVSLREGQAYTDVDRFRRAVASTSDIQDELAQTAALRAALELYRGELLPGYYDDWVCDERRSLEHIYHEALTKVIGLLCRQGAASDALPYALRGAAIDPLNEQAQSKLMEVYSDLGQFARAIETFEVLRARMLTDLGVEPSIETFQRVKGVDRTNRTIGKPLPDLNRAAVNTLMLPEARAAAYPRVTRIELPSAASSFHGRKVELVELKSVLSPIVRAGETAPSATHHRLVTLTGLGGIGKTRLGLQAAILCAPQFSGGAWFVPLAEVEDSRQVTQSIADSLHLRLVPHRSNIDQVVDELRERTELGPALVLLDNFEQLVGPGSAVVDELLSKVIDLSILVTSRRLLGLTAEHEFHVEPLDLPEPGAKPNRVMESDSVDLFKARAQAAQPDFQLTSRNKLSVETLCHQLDGIPLAIELAAARIRLLTPAQMITEMDQRFDLLVNRRATKDSRHRSLLATIESSVQVLPYPVREFFALLSVFRGSWNLEAARAVSGSTDALDMLDDLVGYSLIHTRAREGEVRYSMLETIREYAAGLVTRESQAQVDLRHAKYYMEWTQICERMAVSSHRNRVCAQYELEKENIRTAWTWALRHDTKCALETASNLRWVFFVLYRLREGEEMIMQSLKAAGNAHPDSAARANVSLGVLRCFMDDFSGAAEPLRTAIAGRGDRHDRETWIGMAFFGWVTMHEGDFDGALSKLQEARQLFSIAGECWHEAACLNLMGFAACYAGRLAQARQLFADSYALYLEAGDPEIAIHSTLGMGRAAWMEGKLDEGEMNYRAALSEFRRNRDLRGTAYSLEGLARISSDRDMHADAMLLTGASQRVRDQIASLRDPMDQAAHEVVVRAASAALDEEQRADAWNAGYHQGEQAAD